MTVGQLARSLGLDALAMAGSAHASTVVTGVTLDSRGVRPGDLFAAVPGANLHRAGFVAEAVAAGAVAVLTDPAGEHLAARAGVPILVVADPRASLGDVAALVYGRPAERLLTIGVTGTNGKTTTTYLVEAGLRAAGLAPGLIGTVQTRLDAQSWASERTTPEAPDLQALLALMAEHGAHSVTMEVSSHALVLGRVDGVRFDVAVFTNLGVDHLDFHGDLDAYFAAKASLFTPRRSRVGVVNVDDPYGRRLVAESTVPVSTYSVAGAADADWRASQISAGSRGSTFSVAGPDGATVEAAVSMPGHFNVANALAAIAALVAARVPLDRAAAGVAACPGVPGRMESIDAGQDFAAIVDYAHTPDAVASVLATLRPVTAGRLLLVLGCGGDRDRSKRALMGEVGARGSDVFLVTDDNPRSEDPAEIRAAMLAGARTVPDPERAVVREVAGRERAIAEAVALAAAADVLLVAGRGHESKQEVAGEHRPLDDRAVVRQAIALSQLARR